MIGIGILLLMQHSTYPIIPGVPPVAGLAPGRTNKPSV